MRFVESGKAKLSKMYAYLRGKGAEHCAKFFQEFGEEFARLFVENWENSYSGNNGRFIAGLIEQMERKGLVRGQLYADLACGPMVLEQTLGSAGSSRIRRIASVDLNGYMLEYGKQMLAARTASDYKPYFSGQGNMANLEAVDSEHFSDKALHLLNCSSALHYTKLGRRTTRPENKRFDERVQTLMEFNRVLKADGILLLTFPPRTCTDAEFVALCQQALPSFGFEVLSEFTGQGESRDIDNYGHRFTNMTIVCRKVSDVDLRAIEQLDLNVLTMTRRAAEGGAREPAWDPDADNRKLREGFRHTDFEIQNQSFQFDVDIRMQREQAIRLREIETNIRRLREVYVRNGSSFENLPEHVEQELLSSGIHLFFFESNGHRTCYFTFQREGKQLFQPLDETLWGSLSSEGDASE